MIKRHSDLVLEITAYDAHMVENDLNAAVEIVRRHAMQEGRHGILVTQHGYTRYTVAVSPDVPFGQTQERRELGQRETSHDVVSSVQGQPVTSTASPA